MLVSSLAVLFGAYAAGVVRLWRTAGYGRGIRPFAALAFGGGWLALVVAVSPPVDEWSDRWLSAHMIQHELLMVIAAPLIALSAPAVALLWALPTGTRRRMVESSLRPSFAFAWTAVTSPLSAFLLHALALWVWHLPALYDYALEHEGVHVLQHICFFATAALFWWAIIHGRYGRIGYGVAVIYVFATTVHGGVLGALLALSPRVWYAQYLVNHGAALTPLEDQQLAGLLMWVPAGLIFVVGGLALFAAWLRQSERLSRSLHRVSGVSRDAMQALSPREGQVGQVERPTPPTRPTRATRPTRPGLPDLPDLPDLHDPPDLPDPPDLHDPLDPRDPPATCRICACFAATAVAACVAAGCGRESQAAAGSLSDIPGAPAATRVVAEVSKGEWRMPAGDYGNLRYSTLDAITTTNVMNLRVITTFSTGVPHGHEGQEKFPIYSGVLATGGDVVFYGTMDGWFKAADARTGTELWKFHTASGIVANPVTYLGADGKQYVAVYSGIGGWMGAVAFPDISADDPYAALGVVGAMKDIKKYTAPGSTVYVFGL